jgi:hypothetical protein
MRQWLVGVIIVAMVAVCLPLLWNALTQQPVHYAHVFGGHEFILAGMVVMLGGVVELWGVGVRPERERDRTYVMRASYFAISVGIYGYGARYSVYVGNHDLAPNAFSLFVCSFIFTISAVVGTSAVLLATGW